MRRQMILGPILLAAKSVMREQSRAKEEYYNEEMMRGQKSSSWRDANLGVSDTFVEKRERKQSHYYSKAVRPADRPNAAPGGESFYSQSGDEKKWREEEKSLQR